MKKQDKRMEMVGEFHTKYKIPILDKPSLIPKDRSDLRFKLIDDEVQEYRQGVENVDLENIAKELVDILYGVYGTIYEHGLQDKLDELFEEVHRSHMTKDYHQYKQVKGVNYIKPDLKRILDK